MISDMIALLHDEFVLEVPATREMMSAWQAAPERVPAQVQNMVSLMDRTTQAANTLGLDGLAAFLMVVQQFCESAIYTIEETLRQQQTIDPPMRENLVCALTWLSQWVDHVLRYFEHPVAEQTTEQMCKYLLECPQSIDEEIVAQIAAMLQRPPSMQTDMSHQDELVPVTPNDVSLALDDVDPQLLQALLVDAPQQLLKLHEVVTLWGSGQSTPTQLLEAQRVAHTIKGSGNIIGLPGIGRIAHRLEDILEFAVDMFKQNQAPVNALVRDILQSVFCLEQMVSHLQGDEAPPDNSLEILQRLQDWVALLRSGSTDSAHLNGLMPETIVSLPGDPPAVAEAIDVTTAAIPAEPRARDGAQLRLNVAELSRMLRRAGQSIVHAEHMSKLLDDMERWMQSMERNNNVLSTRLRDLEVMVTSQVTQLREAQQVGEDFDPLEMDRYDALYGLSRSISESARDSSELVKQAQASAQQAHAILRNHSFEQTEQHKTLLSARLVMVKSIVPRLKRTVSQTAASTGKEVDLQVLGEEVAIDADVLARLTEPLLHLLRNAIDHGIESPLDRSAVAKPEQGKVLLNFQRVGEEVILRVQDDGRGLDLVAIENRALHFGLIQPGHQLSEFDLHQLILKPGFSTRDTVTETSGRGVGMDVVNDRIQGLKGRLDIQSSYGSGSCFTLRVPVTTGVAHALVVETAGQEVALPIDQVITIVAAGVSDISPAGNRLILHHNDKNHPAYVLSQWLELESHTPEQVLEKAHLLIPILIKSQNGEIALLVDAVHASRELILQDIGRLARRIRGVVGGAFRPDGRPIFMLDVSELEMAVHAQPMGASALSLRQRVQVERTRILVVDDAWSVRRSMEQLLGDAGYEVVSAADGFEALDQLRSKIPAMVLTDLEMPNLNGLELTRRVREIPAWSHIPVAMITSRTSDKHRNAAVTAGVNVYLTKPYQDIDLLKHVRELCARQEWVA